MISHFAAVEVLKKHQFFKSKYYYILTSRSKGAFNKNLLVRETRWLIRRHSRLLIKWQFEQQFNHRRLFLMDEVGAARPTTLKERNSMTVNGAEN